MVDMAKKRKRNKNPLLQEKYDEGFKAGIEHATYFFLKKFEGLQNVEGIGKKTMDKIKKQLGEKYFKQ